MKVYIIGAGPGDPELITVKGLKLIESADVIMYTDSLVNPQLFKNTKKSAEIVKTAGMHLEEMADIMIDRVKQQKRVVRVHTGDSSIFGAVMEQVAILKRASIEVEIVPGVSSVFASAAAAQADLTIPNLTQTVILTRAEGRTPVPEREKLRDLASHHCTIALFLSATLAKKIVKQLLEADWSPDTPAVVVYKASWPDEKVVRTTIEHLAQAMRENKIHKQAMILAGWALDPNIHEKDYRSKLYDKTFTHSYRRGVT